MHPRVCLIWWDFRRRIGRVYYNSLSLSLCCHFRFPVMASPLPCTSEHINAMTLRPCLLFQIRCRGTSSAAELLYPHHYTHTYANIYARAFLKAQQRGEWNCLVGGSIHGKCGCEGNATENFSVTGDLILCSGCRKQRCLAGQGSSGLVCGSKQILLHNLRTALTAGSTFDYL